MKAILLTIAFGLLALLVDMYFAEVILAPFLCVIWLLFMARTQPWKRMVAIFGVLFCIVVLSLVDEKWVTIALRSSGFCLTGIMAVAFSRARQRAEDTVTSTYAIIRAIPSPIVVVDLTGSIVTASDAVKEWIPDYLGTIVGHSFADIFLGHLPPGQAMKTFLDWFHVDGQREEVLHIRSQPETPIPSSILTTGEGKDRLLVAVLHLKV